MVVYPTNSASGVWVAPGSTRLDADSRARILQIVDLRHLRARDLDPLLLEQTIEWGLNLDWDFSKSADLLRKFADAPGLNGAALLDDGVVVGYGCTGLEERKGLVWDVYVRPGWRGGNAEPVLFRALRDGLIETSGVRRIESQLMLLERASAKALQRECSVQLFERILMTRGAGISQPPGRASASMKFRFESWNDHHYEPAATVLLRAYAGHIDSQINDHYRTFPSAFRFLHDLVQVPGCAAFCPSASYIAFEAMTGEVAGISLASFIADDVGHITELCVMPHARGEGLGSELLRRSLATLRSAGAKRISLTVTAANEEAVRLYLQCGFRELRRFYAYVWEQQACEPRRFVVWVERVKDLTISPAARTATLAPRAIRLKKNAKPTWPMICFPDVT
jgi:ribosomal protein S18 acetylase RimI-like enzyme